MRASPQSCVFDLVAADSYDANMHGFRPSVTAIAATLLLLIELVAANPTPLQWAMEDGRLLVEVRPIAQWFDMETEWYPATRAVVLTSSRRLIVLQIDFPKAWVDGTEQPLEVPARFLGGRVYVPLRFLVEALGGQIGYHNTYFDITRGDEQIRRFRLEAKVSSEG